MKKNRTTLTDEQKGRICGILSVGCDRETAADFVGCSVRELHCAMQHDSEFAAHVRRTEAATELAHVRTIQEAAKDPKNWRASVWWLEMRSPERFKRGGPAELTLLQIKEFFNVLSEIICDEVQHDGDQQRIIMRMQEALRELEGHVRQAEHVPTQTLLAFEAAHASCDVAGTSEDSLGPSGNE